jgi:putative peptidoglycan lipid II flippase
LLRRAAGSQTFPVSKSLKNISIVSTLTMVSRVLGLARESLTAAFFGTGGLISAFFTGLTLPNLFRRMLAEGGLTAALVPTLNEELEHRQKDAAFRLVNQVASWLLVVTGGLVLLAAWLFSQEGLIRQVGAWASADAETIARWIVAAHFTVVLFPYLALVSLAAAFSAALQSLHRFVEPALSPIWLNLSIIGLLGFSVKLSGGDEAAQVNWLCAGWLVGGFLQMAVPAAALIGEGWRPRADFSVTDPLRAMVRLMMPTLFSSSIYLVNMSASRFIGLSLNDAAVAVLNFAQRLMELPIGVFAVAVSTVVFPLISRYAAAGQSAELTRAYRKGMGLILVINVPAAAGLAVLALPIVRLLFQYGRFHADATASMTPVLVANAVGLPFLSFASLALRAFYAQKDTVTPVRAAVLSFVLNVGLSLALMGSLSTVGLAIASSVAVAVQAAYLQWQLARKHEGFAFRHLTGDLVKVCGASLVMAVIVFAGWLGWARVAAPTKLMDAVGVALLIGVGVSVYGGIVWFLRIEGREELTALWTRVRGKFA